MDNATKIKIVDTTNVAHHGDIVERVQLFVQENTNNRNYLLPKII
jgi:hypothetical protein